MAGLQPLFEERTTGAQGIEYTAVYDVRNGRVRVTVRRDAEDAKSFARAEIFNHFTSRWYPLTGVSWQNMKALVEPWSEQLALDDKPLTQLQADVLTLLRQASLILP